MDMDSILGYIKKVIGGIDEDNDYFDPDLIMFINAAFTTLCQLGIGPETPFKIEDDSAELEVSEIQENNVPTSQNKNNTLFIINDNQNIIEQEQDSILAFESKINETLNEVPYDNSLVLQQKNQIKTAFENQHYNTIRAKREVNQDILRQQERNTQIHQNTQKILGQKRKKDNTQENYIVEPELLNVSQSKINDKENKK